MAKISSFTDLGTTPADDDYLILHDEDVKSYRHTYSNFKTWAFLNHSPIIVDSFNFDAADIATLNTSPKEIVSDIPASQRVIILNAVVYYNYGTAPYTDRRLVIKYGSVNATNDSNFENSGADSVCLLAPTTTYYIPNDNIIFTCNTGDPGAVGDGVMELQITYQYINV